MSEPSLKININLDALLGELQTSLQQTINLVAVALTATAPADGEELRLPGEIFATTYASRVRWSQKEATERHSTWAISNGFRDAVEGVSSFLESAHRVATVWKLVAGNGGKVKVAEFNREMEGKAFHRLGLPDKLEHLKKEHDVPFDAVLERQLVSVNTARNCLVHRQGIVGDRDVNLENKMRVEWRRLHYFVRDEDGDHELVLNKALEKDGTVCLKVIDEFKEFALGERVVFTTQEFANTAWGLFSFGSELVASLGKMGPRSGSP